MAVMVKKAVLWRKEIDNRPGVLANTLEPLSKAGTEGCKSSWAIVTLWKGYGPNPATSHFR